MKKKAILCLILIGVASFNLIGCKSNDKDINQKVEQQESISDKSSETNEENINNKENNSEDTSKDKTSEKDKVVEDKKDTKTVKADSGDKKTTQQSKKQTYKKKLDDIQIGLKDLTDLYAGNTMEMKSAASQEYERWDKALNEIYGVLKQELSTENMNKLKQEQIKWISDRDDKAKKASSQYKGGTAEPLVYTSSLAQTTKERCYELVEKYMK